jgi:hypothetical protein
MYKNSASVYVYNPCHAYMLSLKGTKKEGLQEEGDCYSRLWFFEILMMLFPYNNKILFQTQYSKIIR